MNTKQSTIDIEIESITSEIVLLDRIRERLCKVRDASSTNGGDEPKVRKTRRKRTVGLPQATPPASEANHLKTGERL